VHRTDHRSQSRIKVWFTIAGLICVMRTRFFCAFLAVLLLAGPASAAEEKAKPDAKKGSEHKLTEAVSYLALGKKGARILLAQVALRVTN